MARWFVQMMVLVAALAAALPAFAEEVGASPRDQDWDARMRVAKEKQHRSNTMRAEETQRFDAEQLACYKKFRVIDCQRESRLRHNQVVRQAQVIDNEGKAEERQVRKERREDKDARQAVENERKAAELPGKAAEVEAERQRADAEREGKLKDKARQAQEGQQRRAHEAERLQAKREAHERKVQKQMEKAARREAQKAPQQLQ